MVSPNPSITSKKNFGAVRTRYRRELGPGESCGMSRKNLPASATEARGQAAKKHGDATRRNIARSVPVAFAGNMSDIDMRTGGPFPGA